VIGTNIPLKKRIRKFLVHNFIGHRRFKVFGHSFRERRSLNYGLGAMLFMLLWGLVVNLTGMPEAFGLIGAVPMLVFLWIVSPLDGIFGYFQMWPVRWEELDDEQIDDMDDDDNGMRPTPTIKVT